MQPRLRRRPRRGFGAGVRSPAAGVAGEGTRKPTDRRTTVSEQANDAVGDDLASSWAKVQDELRSSLIESTYGLWFAPLRPLSARGPVLYLTGPQHVRRWVARRYPELLRAALAQAGTPYREAVLVEPGGEGPAPAAAELAGAEAAINPSYSFERFVIGDGNRLAHAAALAVAEAPGQSYNPLFLHGPPGLGKTHLLGAIAGYLHEHSPDLAVHYTTAESFTNEFVGAVQAGGIEGFKRRYRRADVLLIDDVQFLEGKTRTAEELFHTFNALYESGAQLVFTADRVPAELSALAERLRQRFEWGLTASLQPPDLSTRLLFAANLVRERGEQVAPEAMRAIASRAVANLRLLEGAITRVLALASLTADSVTVESVDRALPSTDAEQALPELGVTRIQELVAAELGVSTEALLSTNRSAAVSRARQVAMYLTRELTELSLPATAAAFERRDHTTVLYAVKRVEQRRHADPQLDLLLERLATMLRDERCARAGGNRS